MYIKYTIYTGSRYNSINAIYGDVIIMQSHWDTIICIYVTVEEITLQLFHVILLNSHYTLIITLLKP